MQKTYDYKTGLSSMAITYAIWGFQPLFFHLDKDIDTLFLLAGRILWAAVICLVILKAEGKLGALLALFRSKEAMKREIPATLFLFADWALYLVGIRADRVMECAMGYYIMPLVMVLFGAVVYREKLFRQHYIALGFILVGISLSVGGFGGFPTLAILLALSFPIYAAIKKSYPSDYLVSTSAEILMMAVPALLYLLILGRGETGLGSLTPLRQLFLTLSGVITAVPMVYYAKGLSCLPMVLLGIIEYAAPTLDLLCGRILGESFSKEKLISFAFIWMGILVFTVYEFRTNKRSGDT